MLFHEQANTGHKFDLNYQYHKKHSINSILFMQPQITTRVDFILFCVLTINAMQYPPGSDL